MDKEILLFAQTFVELFKNVETNYELHQRNACDEVLKKARILKKGNLCGRCPCSVQGPCYTTMECVLKRVELCQEYVKKHKQLQPEFEF